MKNLFLLWVCCSVLSSCSNRVSVQQAVEPGSQNELPVAISNNAVAVINDGDTYRLYSFFGLLEGKSWRDVTDRAFEYKSTHDRWDEIDPVPGGAGRLASTAQAVSGSIYIFGGYTVAEDHTEVSRPEVFEYQPDTGRYIQKASIPLPVDDAVSAVYQDRYIYLISGWHDKDNVADVQIYDTQTDAWVQASDYPGPPVFGHSGGIADGVLVICGGVKVVPLAEPGKRTFKISQACYSGQIDPADPAYIDWQPMPSHPGPALYRAASTGFVKSVVFAGGSDNPYNYNGIGYDGVPSQALRQIWAYDVVQKAWLDVGVLAQASMDHRGLLVLPEQSFAIIAGMGEKQRSLSRTVRFSLPDLGR